jgi:tryptophan synthase alpha subunit
MTNRIDEKFAALKAENRSAFIVYITGGDPSLDKTIEIASTLERAGADVLEIGVPFSDPLADGVANQLGALRGHFKPGQRCRDCSTPFLRSGPRSVCRSFCTAI